MDKHNTDATRRNNTQPRRPPFGADLAARRRRGEDPLDVLIITGAEAWDLAALIGARDARRNAILVAPTLAKADRYNWRLLAGLSCRIWPTTPTQGPELDYLALDLIRAGAPLVQIVAEDGEGACYWPAIYYPKGTEAADAA
jgi:hypothetical protein